LSEHARWQQRKTCFGRIIPADQTQHLQPLVWLQVDLDCDGAYDDIITWVKQQFGWRLEIIRRPPGAKGFQVLPRRWVVERTFGWLGRYRRLTETMNIKPFPVSQWFISPASIAY
jgi:hypothetical protein